MSPIGSRHAACVARLSALLTVALQGEAIVWVQNPVRLDEWSEPQPDLTLLRPSVDYYAAAHPGPADVLLVVEVADTSAASDRAFKLPRYAAAGIVEVWLVDLAAATVEVWSAPEGRTYGQVRRTVAGDRLAPAAFPGVSLAVDPLLA